MDWYYTFLYIILVCLGIFMAVMFTLIMKKIMQGIQPQDERIRNEICQKGYEAQGKVVAINPMETPDVVFDTIFASNMNSVSPLRPGIHVRVNTVIDGMLDVRCILDGKNYEIDDTVIIRYLKYANGYRGCILKRL